MKPHPSVLHWRRDILFAAVLATLILAFFALVALRAAPGARAQQQDLGLEIDKTLQGSNVVQVGQLLTFTIRITNTGNVTVTRLPLFDEFEEEIIRFERADPPPSSTGAGTLTWDDLVPIFGDLPPGGTYEVVTVFRAIRAEAATINRARIGTALGEGGFSGGGQEDQDQGTAEGGQVTIEKALAPGITPTSGQPLTFTITIRNEGAADVVQVPLQDDYDTQYLQFWRANPPPSTSDPVAGALRWGDVLPQLGLTRLRPNEVVTVTTVFTALQTVDSALVNSAGANGVRDEFDNQLAAPRRAEVPIVIVGGSGAAPTSTPIPTPERDDGGGDDDDDEPTATPAPTATPVATPQVVTPTMVTEVVTPTRELTTTEELTSTDTVTGEAVAPAQLPATGATGGTTGWLLVSVALLAGSGLLLLYRRTR